MGCTMALKATTVRLDEGLKAEAVDILDKLGLNFNTFITMATKQLVYQQRLPFEPLLPPLIPTEETWVAMAEAEGKMYGYIPDDAPTFHSAAELMAYLERD